jgi:hypothetical protein
MKVIAASMVGLVALAGVAGTSRADIVAAFADGHGGVATEGGAANPDGTSSSATGLGYRLGARLLIFEGYYDYTGFGGGSSVTRGILGVRGGFGSQKLRLVLRAGGGMIEEEGGALTGRTAAAPDRRGAVGRIGAAVEGRVAPLLLVGVGIDGERFVLPATGGPYGIGAVTGSNVFAKLHVLFELGV